jgi:hypothetical protein
VITAGAVPGWISGPISGPAPNIMRALSVSITRAGI